MRNLRNEVRRIVQEEVGRKRGIGQLNESVYVPDNIKEFAKRKGVYDTVKTVAKWLKKLNRKIVGGTAIGKHYDTLILDITHHGSEIYIDTDNDTIQFYGEEVHYFEDFKQIYMANN